VKRKPTLAVVSPFLDKRHGTERLVIEWITQLSSEFEIHIYSQHVEDLDLSTVIWHRVSRLPGPHLFSFLWWFATNCLRRAWDRQFHGLRYDIVYSPGPNCLDADVISVHILFAEYARRAQPELSFNRNSIWSWPLLVHRKLYYRLAIALERLAYARDRVTLFSTSRKTATDLGRIYGGRRDPIRVIYAGLDHAILNSMRRLTLRERARKLLGLSGEQFVVLLIGNDWRNKGLPVLLQALVILRPLPIHLLVVSAENSAVCDAVVRCFGLDDRVDILPPRNDVELYYAAADLYAGPSLEDAFALPPAEAMACGLPVIVSASAGVSEIITDGSDGLILQDPTDANALARMIRRLYEDHEYRDRLAKNAEKTARQFTWERSGRELNAILEKILRCKARPTAQPLAQERDA